MATVPPGVTQAVSDAMDTSYTQGKADQAITDAAALAAAVAQTAEVQAAFDAYVASHPDPVDPPPPPPPALILGMNFEPKGAIATFNAPYEPRAHAARIFVEDGRTDIRQEPQFARAYAAGIRVFAFSWEDTNVQWFGTVPSDVTWYGIRTHEPEAPIAKGEITLAQWQASQARDMPLVRAHGGNPWICLMSYTVNPVSGRNVTDYKLPAGLVDGVFWDYYPNKEAKPTQAQSVARMKAGNTALGLTRYGFGEYGILNGSSTFTAATVTEFKALISDAEVACYWSNQQAQNQKFTPAVADAWFA